MIHKLIRIINMIQNCFSNKTFLFDLNTCCLNQTSEERSVYDLNSKEHQVLCRQNHSEER